MSAFDDITSLEATETNKLVMVKSTGTSPINFYSEPRKHKAKDKRKLSQCTDTSVSDNRGSCACALSDESDAEDVSLRQFVIGSPIPHITSNSSSEKDTNNTKFSNDSISSCGARGKLLSRRQQRMAKQPEMLTRFPSIKVQSTDAISGDESGNDFHSDSGYSYFGFHQTVESHGESGLLSPTSVTMETVFSRNCVKYLGNSGLMKKSKSENNVSVNQFDEAVSHKDVSMTQKSSTHLAPNLSSFRGRPSTLTVPLKEARNRSVSPLSSHSLGSSLELPLRKETISSRITGEKPKHLFIGSPRLSRFNELTASPGKSPLLKNTQPLLDLSLDKLTVTSSALSLSPRIMRKKQGKYKSNDSARPISKLPTINNCY